MQADEVYASLVHCKNPWIDFFGKEKRMDIALKLKKISNIIFQKSVCYRDLIAVSLCIIMIVMFTMKLFLSYFVGMEVRGAKG